MVNCITLKMNIVYPYVHFILLLPTPIQHEGHRRGDLLPAVKYWAIYCSAVSIFFMVSQIKMWEMVNIQICKAKQNTI